MNKKPYPPIYLITVAVLIVLAIAGWTVYNSIRYRGQLEVTIMSVPGDSTLTLDGHKINQGDAHLKPGVHTIIASRQFFTTTTRKVDTKYLTKGQTVYVIPGADTPAARQYIKDHPEVQRELDKAGAIEDQQTTDTLKNRYPFIGNLPYVNSHFRVDYSLDSNNNISFTITLYAIINGPGDYAKYKQQLADYKADSQVFLKSQNIDPNKYKISYIPPEAQ